MKPKTKKPVINSPVPMWDDTDKTGIRAKCEYLSDKHKFKVTVSRDGKSYHELFSAQYEPRFGMDVSDMNESMATAERLAKKIEEG